jgi:hypothetical protein
MSVNAPAWAGAFKITVFQAMLERLAIAANFVGIWSVQKISTQLFYRIA